MHDFPKAAETLMEEVSSLQMANASLQLENVRQRSEMATLKAKIERLEDHPDCLPVDDYRQLESHFNDLSVAVGDYLEFRNKQEHGIPVGLSDREALETLKRVYGETDVL